MLSKQLQDALNAQVNAEFWSAYLYLSMSVDFSAKGTKASPTGSPCSSARSRTMPKS